MRLLTGKLTRASFILHSIRTIWCGGALPAALVNPGHYTHTTPLRQFQLVVALANRPLIPALEIDFTYSRQTRVLLKGHDLLLTNFNMFVCFMAKIFVMFEVPGCFKTWKFVNALKPNMLLFYNFIHRIQNWRTCRKKMVLNHVRQGIFNGENYTRFETLFCWVTA